MGYSGPILQKVSRGRDVRPPPPFSSLHQCRIPSDAPAVTLITLIIISTRYSKVSIFWLEIALACRNLRDKALQKRRPKDQVLPIKGWSDTNEKT